MTISHEDFQRARRISRAIQEHLEQANADGLRSTDVYPVLARKGLIEKDRHNGLHLRKFLRKLKDHKLLHLIPQCSERTTSTEFMEWHFFRVSKDKESNKSDDRQLQQTRPVIAPKNSKEDLDLFVEKIRPNVALLPKRDTSFFTPQMLEIRDNYPRAYERWTKKEIEIMIAAHNLFSNIEKVAELLGRQPSVIEKQLLKFSQ